MRLVLPKKKLIAIIGKQKTENCRTCHIVRDTLAGRNYYFKSFICHIYYNTLFGLENLFVLTRNGNMGIDSDLIHKKCF